MTLAALRLLACALACVAACAARADWTLVEERFHALSLGGMPCGRSVDRVERDGARVRTVSEIEMRFRRGGQRTDIRLSTEFVEDDRGRPLEAKVVQNGAVASSYRFATAADGAFAVVVAAGGSERRESIADDGWLPPEAARAFVAARVKAEAKAIRLRAISIQSGLVAPTLDLAFIADGEFALPDGRRIATRRYSVTNSLVPVPGSETYDREGRLVESATSLSGLGELVMRLSTREAAADSLARADFDLLRGTFVATKSIAGFERLASIAVAIRATDGSLEDLPSIGAQRFERVDAARGIVRVEVARGSEPEAGDATDARWTRETAVVDHGSAAVRELLARAPRTEGVAAFERAEGLRRLVARHLSRKDFASAFASAGEAARSRGGDCTEHAVLLAALLRADGVPARVVSGLVYVPAIAGSGSGWGWHLWTQALVAAPGDASPRWHDFDATVSGGKRGFHAAHVAVAASDLSGGASDPAFLQALGLIGGIEIERIESKQAGENEESRR
ncbi:MAG: transglutaminase domain-containing protein [Planctomycetota bacterium]